MKKSILLLAASLLAASLQINAQTVSTIAGNGSSTYSGDGGSALSAGLVAKNVAIDKTGNIYIVDESNGRIRCINITTGIINTVVGTGANGYSGDGGPATNAQINNPNGMAFDKYGNMYIADGPNSVIRKVDTFGIITTVAGGGGVYTDSVMATDAGLDDPYGVAVDTFGNIYIAGAYSNMINKVNTAGIITTIAGNGTTGFSGDGGPATAAELSYPTGVAVDNAGNVYVADNSNNRIRKINAAGIITTVVGSGTVGTIPGGMTGSYTGDGGPATAATINTPYYLYIDNSGNMYIPDQGNNVVRMVNAAGIITTIAGNGTAGFSGDGGPATAAEFNAPTGVAMDDTGNVLIADDANSRIRKISGLVPAGVAVVSRASEDVLLAYPNPNNGTFSLKVTSPNNENTAVTISDLLGNIIMKSDLKTNTLTTLSLNVSPGVYFISAQTGSGKQNMKIEVW